VAMRNAYNFFVGKPQW